MRVVPILTVGVMLTWLTAGASAQFGLYGAPEILRLPPAQPEFAQPFVYRPPQYPNMSPPQGPVIPAASLSPAPTAATSPTLPDLPAPPTAQPYEAPSGPTGMDPYQYIYAPPAEASPPVVAPSPSPIRPLAPARPVMPAEPPPVLQPRPEPPALQPRPEQPNIVSQMVQEGAGTPGGCGYARPCDAAGSEDCATGCEPCVRSPWYALGHYLNMGRNQANRLWTSYNAAVLPDQIGNSQIGLEWRSGGEIRFGRRFCCDTWAVEATYWTLDAMTGYASFTIPGGLVSTPLRVSEIEFGTVNGHLLFDDALEHRLWRRDEFHNVELNLLRRGLGGEPDGNWNVEWCAGARFFRFEDDFRFGSLRTGTWGGSGGVYEAYLRDDIRNNLIGFQVGFDAKSNNWNNLQLFFTPQFGVYNNQIENTFRLWRGDGVIARPTAASLVTDSYPVHSTKNVISFLAEVDLGVNWQITPRWSARVGYRVLAATNIGFAEHQIPVYIVDIPEIRDIDYNGDLIVHGAFAGLTYNF